MPLSVFWVGILYNFTYFFTIVGLWAVIRSPIMNLNAKFLARQPNVII
jgi:hypothetical protein